MPKDACLNHKIGYFVQTRQDYSEMFNGDHCAAVLMWVLEYFTNNELNRKRSAKEDGPPWVRMSISQIEVELLSAFSRRALQERLNFLRNSGLVLAREQPSGKVNEYLLNLVEIQKLLDSGARMDVASDLCKIALVEKAEDQCAAECKNDAEIALVGDALHKEVRSKKEEEELPVVPLQDFEFENIYPEDDVIKFVTDAYSRKSHRESLDNLKAKSSERLCEQIRQAERDHDVEPFRFGLLAYLSSSSDWVRQEKWPIRGFLSKVDEYIPSLPQNGNGHGKASHPAAVDLPPVVLEPLAQPALPGLPYPCQEWNRVVTAGEPVEDWTRRDKPLEVALNDPDFLAKLPKILERCQAARSGNEEMTRHVNFRWLLKPSKKISGVENWYAVLTGDLAWAKEKKGGPRKSAAQSAVEEALAQLGG